MSEPRRWIDEQQELSSDELRALQAGLASPGPKPEQTDELWAGLVAQLPIGVGGGGTDGGAGASGAGAAGAASTAGATKGAIGAGAVGGTKGAVGAGATGVGAAVGAGKAAVGVGLVLKSFGIGVGLATAALAGHHVWVSQHDVATQQARPARVVQMAAAVNKSSKPASLSGARRESARDKSVQVDLKASDTPAKQRRATEKPQVVGATSAAIPNDRFSKEDAGMTLRLESAMTAKARRQLHTGNPVGALATLAELGRRVPSGILGQEREALTIEALARTGQREQAKRRAQAFLARFPHSPHAGSVRAVVGRQVP